ncbi:MULTISPECIES: pyocin activator PrtN family protein [Acinetobacter]|nr:MULTISPECIES: pyocin activator PrtN family protein [Acinetobacter]SSS79036.1 Pyocin activator protein PrtN [Acinetobacter baumannii]
MNKVQMNLSDYLFMQFKTITPTLEQVGAMYYPHLSKAKLLEKARNMDFPFPCYRIDDSQKAPYLINLADFSEFLSKALRINQPYIDTDIHQTCKNNG